MNKKIRIVLFAALLLIVIVSAGCSEKAPSGYVLDSIKKLDSASGLVEISGKLELSQAELSNNGLNADDKLWVIIETSCKSVAEAYSDEGKGPFSDFLNFKGESIRSENKAFNDEIRESISSLCQADFKYDYYTLTSGFSAYIRYGDIEAVRNIAGVEAVLISDSYSVPTTAASEIGGLFGEGGIFVNETENKGEGILVGVLDTGLDYTHSAFLTIPEDIVFTEEHTVKFSERTGRGRYINDKVPYSYDYADGDNDVYPVLDHGTHVAGIIAGDDGVITGSASKAQLAIFKVFSDFGSGASQNDIISALEDAVLLGVDVINMSLGTPCGFVREIAESKQYVNEIYDTLDKLGVFVCVAMGNEYYQGIMSEAGGCVSDNPDIGVQGSPSTYSASFAVASVDSYTTEAFFDEEGSCFRFNNALNSSNSSDAQAHDFIGSLLDGRESVTLDYVFVNGLGERSDYDGIDVSGKLVLVKRGVSSFEEKQLIAYEAGAAACLIYNYEAGMVNMVIPSPKIPTAFISRKDAEILMQKEGSITVSEKLNAGYAMSEFSSWGVTSDLELSVDISAPGGSIYSAGIGEYVTYSGTSMATPNIAGLAAVMKQTLTERYPELDDRAVRTMAYRLLMSTAQIVTDQYDVPISVRKQGAGVADLSAALSAEAYLYVKGSDRTKLSLGHDPDKTGIYNLSFSLKNLSEKRLCFRIETDVTYFESEDGSLTLRQLMSSDAELETFVSGAIFENGCIYIDGNADADISVTIELSQSDRAYLDDEFKYGAFIEGFVRLTGACDLSIPYLAYYGDYGRLPLLDATIYDDEAAIIYTTQPLAIYQGNYLVPLGSYLYDTPDGVEAPIASAEKNAISMFSDGLSELSRINLCLLRNAAFVRYSVTESVTGEVLTSGEYEGLLKSFYYVSGGAMAVTTVSLDINVWDYALNNNQSLIVRVEALSEYNYINGIDAWEEFSFPLKIDIEAPQLVSSKSYTEDGRSMLEVTVFDNHVLQDMQLLAYNEKTGEARLLYSYALPCDDEVIGDETTYTLDVTDYASKLNQNEDILIIFEDYALNKSAYAFELLPVESEEDALSVIDWNENREYSSDEEFEIKDGELKKYNGNDEVVEIPSDLGIKKIGNKAFQFNTTIKRVIIPEGITSLKNYVFNGCTNLTEVVLPTSLIEMGGYVFAECGVKKLDFSHTGLVSISDHAFFASAELEEVLFPSSLETIGPYPFQNCIKLRSVNLEDTSLKSMHKGFFSNCSSLERIVAPSTLTTTDSELAENCISLGFIDFSRSSVASFRAQAFRYCGSLREARLPSTLTTLEAVVFHCCNSLSVINLEDTSLTAMGNGCFAGCASLKSVILPETLKTLASPGAFAECPSLETVEFRGDVTNFGIRSFHQCYKLKTINLGNNVQEIQEFAFLGSGIESIIIGGNTVPKLTVTAFDEVDLEKLRIFVPEGKRSAYLENAAWATISDNIVDLSDFVIENGVLTEYRGTQSNVVLPHGMLEEIGTDAFYGKKIEKLTLGKGIKRLADRAFNGMSFVTSIVLSEDVSEMGEFVFENCPELLGLDIKSKLPPSINENTFSGLNEACEVYVPMYSLGLYKGNALWSSVNIATTTEFYIENGVLVLYVGTSEEVIIPDEVTEIGDKAFFNNTSIRRVVLPEYLKKIGKNAFSQCISLVEIDMSNCSVEMIDEYAFSLCIALSEVVLPEGLVSIGSYAFQGCTALKTVEFNCGLESIGAYAFSGDSVLREVALPDSVASLGASAFSGCSSLSSLVLSMSLTAIPSEAFAQCVSLTQIDLSGNIRSIGFQAFTECGLTSLVLPENVTELGGASFFGCIKMRSLEIYGDIKCINRDFERIFGLELLAFYGDIGDMTGRDFSYSNKLTQVDFYGSLGKISGEPFTYLESLETVIFQGSVGEIAGYAFNANTQLTKVEFRGSLEGIGQYAFNNCDNLKQWSVSSDNKYLFVDEYSVMYDAELTRVYKQPFGWDYDGVYIMPDSVEEIDDYAFSYYPYGVYKVEYTNMLMYYLGQIEYEKPLLKDVVLSSGIKEVPDYAFYSFTGLKSVGFAQEIVKLKEIGLNAFRNCYSLETIELNEGLEKISDGAFAYAEKLKELIMPDSLTELGMLSFGYCTELNRIVIGRNVNAFNIGSVFTGCDSISEIEVREGSEAFAVIDGVVFNAEKTVLYFYPKAKADVSYTVPEGVKKLADNAFKGNSFLKRVVLPETLLAVGDKAFYETNVRTYIFKSLKAPVLEGKYNESYNLYYANFVDYIENIRNDEGIRVFCPKDGYGYNTYIWRSYFKEIVGYGSLTELDMLGI